MVEEVNEYENIELMDNDKGITNVQEMKDKVRRSGLIYLSSIPLGMTVNSLKQLLIDYGINRVYLVPIKEKQTDDFGKTVQAYKEGWAEFTDKINGKLAEYNLNGKPIGGKKACPYKDDHWTIKYLHKFKWHHLMDTMHFDKNVREKKLKTEIAQSKRENEFIMKNYHKSQLLNKKTKRQEVIDINDTKIDKKQKEEDQKVKESKEEIKKRFKQKKPIYNKGTNHD